MSIRRREFITLLGGAAAWPLAARAQQPSALPRVIHFANNFPDDPETQARHKAFREGLEKLGWADGCNVRIDEQWGSLPVARMPALAAEFGRRIGFVG